MQKLIMAIFISVFVCVTQTEATVYYVKATGNNSNNGLSWANAFLTLQKAMDVVISGDQVWIAKGSYIPTGNGAGKNVCFKLKNNVTIYGGFAGTELTLANRNIALIHATNETVLTGDILGDDDPADATLTVNKSDNAYRVFSHVTADALDATAVLNGVTITGGAATSGTTTGGGMYNQLCNPTLVEVIIKNNIASNGGGMYMTGSASAGCAPVLNNVTITGNIATTTGGGLYCLTNSSPQLMNVVISNNKGNGATASAGAGGMYIINSTLGVYPTLTNVFFLNNTAGNKGGALFIWGSSPAFKNVIISGNSAMNGGGVFITPNGASTPYSYPTFTNVLITNNNASVKGGGFYFETNGYAILTNTTISSNAAPSGGGMYDSINSPKIRNSIIWGNTNNIYNISGSSPVFAYSIVQNSGGSSGWLSVYGTDSVSNLDVDPLFVTSGGYQLQSASPAINIASDDLYTVTGNNLVTDTSLGGVLRKVGSHIDMGAYEFTSVALAMPFSHFAVQKTSEYSALASWEASVEMTQAYVLERSADGLVFHTIGIIKASSQTHYSLTDYIDDDENKLQYYRLKLVGKNDDITFSNIVCINFKKQHSFEIAPNPIRNYIIIKSESSEIFIADATGRIIYHSPIRGKLTVDTRNWIPGIYLLRTSDGFVEKLIKE